MRCRSGWQAESILLADAAVVILSKLQRQQTRILACYLQVFLNASQPAGLSKALLRSISTTFEGLRNALPPVSTEQHAHDNRQVVSYFALQLILRHTLTQPLPQTDELHRSPDYNADLPNQVQHTQTHAASAIHQNLTNTLINRLYIYECGTSTQLQSLIHSLQHPASTSKIPPVDDAAFLDVDELQVSSICCGAATAVPFSPDCSWLTQPYSPRLPLVLAAQAAMHHIKAISSTHS